MGIFKGHFHSMTAKNQGALSLSKRCTERSRSVYHRAAALFSVPEMDRDGLKRVYSSQSLNSFKSLFNKKEEFEIPQKRK